MISEMPWKTKNEMPTGSASAGSRAGVQRTPHSSRRSTSEVTAKVAYLKTASVERRTVTPRATSARRRPGALPRCSARATA